MWIEIVGLLVGAYILATSIAWTLGATLSIGQGETTSVREHELEADLEACCGEVLRLEKRLQCPDCGEPTDHGPGPDCPGVRTTMDMLSEISRLEDEVDEIAADYQSLGNELCVELDKAEEKCARQERELITAHADYASLNSRHMDLVAKIAKGSDTQ